MRLQRRSSSGHEHRTSSWNEFAPGPAARIGASPEMRGNHFKSKMGGTDPSIRGKPCKAEGGCTIRKGEGRRMPEGK